MFKYNISLLFANEERPYAEGLAQMLTKQNITVYYDKYEAFGNYLHKYLQYKHFAQYCVIFISKNTLKKSWTRNELDKILIRTIYKNEKYILPIVMDKNIDLNEFPGIAHIAYIDYNKSSLEQIAEIIINLIQQTTVTLDKCIIDPLGNPISDINNIRVDISEVNDWMITKLRENPSDIYKLSPRRFEELVAEIMIRMGYTVELTPATHDGGKDIYAARKDDLGSFLYLVECKKYAPNHHIGLNVVQRLYGVVFDEKATAGIIVTTSYFTKSAKDFHQRHTFQMSLQDFDSIKKWLCDFT